MLKMIIENKFSSIDIKSCRVCLKTVNKKATLLNEDSDVLKLYKLCTDLSVLPYEKAKSMCSKCTHRIRSFAKFKEKFQKANDVWKSLEAQNVECSTDETLREVKKESPGVELQYDDECDIDNQLDDENKSLLGTSFETEELKLISIIKNPSKTKHTINPKVPTSIINCCGLCNYESDDNETNKEHLTIHWTDANLKCNLCGFSSQDAADLMSHRYIHFPTNRNFRFYWCHMCEKKCASLLSLEFHYRSVHLKKPGGYCSQCRKSFSVFNTWRKHNQWHNTERFICDHCDKKFVYRHEIEAHLLDHSDKRDFICEICGKGFKRKFNLKTHMTSVHSTEAIKCTHCDKVFKSQITYKDHMNVVTAEKRYPCNFCDKSYHIKSALRSHMFWHTGEKPYTCQVCGLKYKSKCHLKVHERNHTGYMPFKCKECEKCFTCSQTLKRHQSVHTGKRRYKCQYCERSFHGKKLLKEHCATSHKGELNGESGGI